MYIIAGLGNPTKEYEKTRHNAGFDAIDVLAEKHGIQITERKHKAFCGTGFIGGERVLLAKPQTFMNLSGESVREAAQFYKIPPEKIVVLFDDISLDVGRLRVRAKGSAGGQNGVKSIITSCNPTNSPVSKLASGANHILTMTLPIGCCPSSRGMTCKKSRCRRTCLAGRRRNCPGRCRSGCTEI